MTDEHGRFRVDGVPLGGVNATVLEGAEMTRRAAGVLGEEGGALELELRPHAMKPKE